MVFVRFHRVHLDKLTVFFLFCGFFRLQPTQSIRLQPTCRIHRQFKYYYMGKNDLVLGRSVAFLFPRSLCGFVFKENCQINICIIVAQQNIDLNDGYNDAPCDNKKEVIIYKYKKATFSSYIFIICSSTTLFFGSVLNICVPTLSQPNNFVEPVVHVSLSVGVCFVF